MRLVSPEARDMNFSRFRDQQLHCKNPGITPLSAFFEGVQAVLPALFGMFPFAMISGIAAVEAGIPPFSALVMSVLVFAGASQLVVLDLMKQHGLPLVIILTGLVMNLRFAMYSAALAPHIRHAAAKWKAIFGYLLTDQAFVLSVARFQRGYRVELKGWYYLGTAFSIWIVWQIGAAAGIFLGSQVPASWSLDFAVPLIFLSMLVPTLKDRPSKAASIASGVTIILAASLPLNLGLLVASAFGILVGFLTERSVAPRAHIR
ncbi:AzlC family protein [Candidatus Vecturithrix granuli]|uniref:AzlC family protein n=1 Tax=Vecturithrix granuli TaxID=1499967 RepID=A0A081C6S3_VECG1|nr:AzlC family protein [Candidatus Vecturithrix granuli]